MKKALIYIFFLVVLCSLISAIDCNIYSCVPADYNWADFSNPIYNGSDVSVGDNILNGGWSIFSGIIVANYTNAVFNSSPLAINLTSDDPVSMNRTYTGSFNTSCLDFLFTDLTTGTEVWYVWRETAGNTRQALQQAGTYCDDPDTSGQLCYKCGADFRNFATTVEINNWYSFCMYWDGSDTFFSLFNGSVNIENVTDSDCTLFDADPFVNGFRSYGTPGISGSLVLDNYREFNGTLGQLGILLEVNDTTPPQITVLFPDITYNDTYNMNMWINFTTNENTNCSLNETAFIVFSDTGTDFRYNESTLDDGFYAVNISCTDSSSNINSTIVYFTKDLTLPTITSTSPLEDNSSSFNNTGQINITFDLSDNIDLRLYNLSIFELDPEVLVFNTSDEISGTSYLFSQLINTTGWDGLYKQTVRTCDSHTALLIKEANGIVKEYDTLKFQFDDINVDIKSIGGNEISTDTTKLKDRYTFKFNYDKVTSSKTYELTSSHKITYLPKSSFKGHFVLGNTLWIDFSNEGKVTVKKSGGNYLITVENSKQDMEFNSIGYLNCVEEHYQFELVGICENVTCTDYTACQPDISGGYQNCTAVNETEECFYEGDYTEFQLSCDYCTPILDTNVFCAVWSDVCPVNYTEYCLDINNTCYNETGSETDVYGAVTRGCVGTYGSGEIVEVIMDNIIGTLAVIFSLIGIIALVLIFVWVVKKYKER